MTVATDTVDLNGVFDRIYVLTLERAGARQRHIEAELGGLDYHFFQGIDKRTLDFDQLMPEGVYDDDAHRRLQRTHRSLIPGEIACALSHRKIYEDAIEHDYQRILVLEDDVALIAENLNAFRQALHELPEDWELLMLGYYSEKYPGLSNELQRRYYQICRKLGLFGWEKINRRFIDNILMQRYSANLWRPGKLVGGHAYALTQSACRKFVEFHTPIFLQADRVFSYYLASGDLRAFALDKKLFGLAEIAYESSIGYAARNDPRHESGKGAHSHPLPRIDLSRRWHR